MKRIGRNAAWWLSSISLILGLAVLAGPLKSFAIERANQDESRREDGETKEAEEADETDSDDDEANDDADTAETISLEKIKLSKAEWRRRLTRDQFYVLRRHGTERAFKNKYWNNKREGVYHCAGCDLPLFDSSTKYKSGTGWPSYYAPVVPEHIETMQDRSLFTVRTEVHCRRCDGHLGHVFPDGPAPTGLRYCINSASLKFEERPKDK